MSGAFGQNEAWAAHGLRQFGTSVRISPTDRGAHAGQWRGLVRKAVGEAIPCFDGMSLSFGDKRPSFESQTMT